MKKPRLSQAVYAPSDDIVTRELEGEIIIIPVGSGLDDVENKLFTLNSTGQAFWLRMDGRRTLAEIVADLATEFNAPDKMIEKDVKDLVKLLRKRRLLVEVSGGIHDGT